jgi:hypothetical protein
MARYVHQNFLWAIIESPQHSWEAARKWLCANMLHIHILIADHHNWPTTCAATCSVDIVTLPPAAESVIPPAAQAWAGRLEGLRRQGAGAAQATENGSLASDERWQRDASQLSEQLVHLHENIMHEQLVQSASSFCSTEFCCNSCMSQQYCHLVADDVLVHALGG